MRILILDDMPARHDNLRSRYIGADFVSCFNVESAVYHAKRWQYDIIHLDHDLEDYEAHLVTDAVWLPKPKGSRGHTQEIRYSERTGEDFARWLVANPPVNKPRCIVHSANPDGAARMVRVLRDAGFRVERMML